MTNLLGIAHEILGVYHFGNPICNDIMKVKIDFVNCSFMLTNAFHALELEVHNTFHKTSFFLIIFLSFNILIQGVL
jgi:hypothetical protein